MPVLKDILWAPTAPPSTSLPELGGGDEGSDEEDDPDVEDLLWSAQMDFIQHRNAHAVTKLHQAVSLRSSAACATLGNLLARGIRDASGKPIDSPPLDGSSAADQPSYERDGLAAANLFITGLQFELAKPIEPASGVGRMGRSRNGGHIERGGSRSSGSESESEEEESAEGRFFNLERVLELVVGLTDSYRYGILKPVDGGGSSQSDPAATGSTLWARGAQVAEETLRHQVVNQPTAATTAPNQPHLPPPSHATHANLSSSARSSSSSPRRATVERSFSHPSTSVPSPSFFPSNFLPPRSHLLSPDLKLRLTIQIHLFYLLALQKLPSDRGLAERYWTEIIRVAANTGGVVGTKEGNEIVAKAQRRLQHQAEPDESWKLVKRRRNHGGTSVSPTTSSSFLVENLATRRLKGAMSGDALVGMWYEKRHPSPSEKGKGKQRESVSEESEGEGDYGSESTITIRPDEAKSEITIRPSASYSNLRRSIDETDMERAALETSVAAVVPVLQPLQTGPKRSKLHLASPVDYPSPPDTPCPSPPDTPCPSPPTAHILFPESTPAQAETKAPASPVKMALPRRIRRQSSTASFQPPTIPRLLRRAESSSSISTLPPDFGSTEVRNPIGRRDWRSSSQPTTSSFTIRDDPPPLPISPPPVAGFWGRVAALRSSSSRVASSLITSFKQEPAKPSAADVLQNVLLKDDLSAGPGMYWADPSELENGEEGEEEPLPPIVEGEVAVIAEATPAVFAPVASGSDTRTSRAQELQQEGRRPELAARRSFVDVTSRAVDCPKVVYTPPTPDKDPKTTVSTSRSKRHRSGSVGIDPLLLELERKSRVGVKTTCETCGKKGLNFPAVRTGETYCSRDCRLTAREERLDAGVRLSNAVVPAFR